MNEKKREWMLNLRYLALFCLIELLFTIFLYFAWQHNRKDYLENRSSHFQTLISSTIEKFDAVSRIIFHEVIEQDDILALQAEAVHADHNRRLEIHNLLLKKLNHTYKRLQKETPLHIQLILPDGISLLRLHEPMHWGDQLHSFREVIRRVNSEKREVKGYESGRYAVGAHRFAFPLTYKGKHVGSVEFSLFANQLIKELDKQSIQSSWFMLVKRAIALPKLITDRNINDLQPSKMNSEYIEIKLETVKLADSVPQLISTLYGNKTIKEQTAQHSLFSTAAGKLDKIPVVADFIPINNFQGQHELYLVGISTAPILLQLDSSMHLVFFTGSLLLLGIVLLARRQSLNRRVIREERATLSAITNAMGEGLLVQDRTGHLLYLNPKTEELLGYTAEDFKNNSVHNLIHQHKQDEDEDGSCPILNATAKGKQYHSLEEKFAAADGRMLPVEVMATPLIRSDSNVGSVTLFRDISEQKAAREQILRMNKLYAALSATNQAIIHISHAEELYHEICRITVDLAGFNAAFIGVLSEDGKSLIPVASAGADSTIVTQPIKIYHTESHSCKLAETLPARLPHICRSRCTLSDVFEKNCACLGDKNLNIAVYPLNCDGKVVSALVLYSQNDEKFDEQQTALLEEMSQDVSFALDTIKRFELHRQTEDELQRLSNFDTLTGLPNRALLLDRIDQSITVAGKNDSTLALLLIGLDRFKEVNNSFGHAVGDQVLREIAQRLRILLPHGTTIARPGGDEFLVLLPDAVVTGCVHFAVMLMSEISGHPLHIEEHSLTITAKVGISLWPNDADNSTALLKNAYSALSRAKQGDEGSYQFFTSDMTASSIKRLTLENELRNALQHQQFILHYQPKIDLKKGKVSGCEALVRWQHPKQGLVAPHRFIPLMEETGLIGQLGEWVLNEACHQAVKWQLEGFEDLYMAVNLSPYQLKIKTLINDVKRILQNSGLAPNQLELEITESAAMHDISLTLTIIENLKLLGIKIAIDDFGTGYSSLSQLKRLAADTLKIDQSFIKDIPSDKDDCAITEAILALAQNLGMQIVAEGVETADQLAFLQTRECRYIQGFIYAKPLPASEFLPFINNFQKTTQK